MTAKRPTLLSRLLIAVLSIAAAVGLTLIVRLWFSLNPTPLILAGVIVASWFGGRYPGLLACLLADLSIDLLFEQPLYEFTPAPVHFVRLTVLIVISLLASSRKNAENQLRIRAEQQAAVARFGQEALSRIPAAELLPKAAELVQSTLDADLSAVCQYMPNEQRLCFTAGEGWDEQMIGKEFDYASGKTIAKAVLEAGDPVIIKDVTRDDRFDHSDDLRKHGVRSGAAVRVLQGDEPYGMLAVFRKRASVFTNDDVNFLLAIANVIAEATQRLKSEEAINEQRTWLKTTLSSIGDGVIATDLNGNVSFMNPVAEMMTGWVESEACGLPLREVFRIVNEDSEEETENPVTQVLATGSVVGLANHTMLISKDGSHIPIVDSAAPITEGGETKGVVLVFSDVSERRAAERSRRETEIMQRLVEAQESERHRIARDLHDHLGQKMTALRLQIESLAKLSAGDQQIEAAIDGVQNSASQIDRDIGFLSWELRPTELDHLGLDDALGSFVREWSSQYGIEAEFQTNVESGSGGRRLSQVIETNLYRIVQEGLNNIVKHANARQVSVLLHHRKDGVVLVIEDDGDGFDRDAPASNNGKPSGLGLVGMHERAALLNGVLEIEGRPGEGTTVLARIPLT